MYIYVYTYTTARIGFLSSLKERGSPLHMYMYVYIYMLICLHYMYESTIPLRRGESTFLSDSILCFSFLSVLAFLFFDSSGVRKRLGEPPPTQAFPNTRKTEKQDVDSPLLKGMVALYMYGHTSIYIY